MRREDWEQRLSSLCIDKSEVPHVWGEWDCVIFCAMAVEEMTGENLIADIKGAWTSKIGAARVIKNNGFDSLGDMVADRLKEKPLPFIKRGDVVLCDGPDGEFIGIVMGHFSVGPGPTGLASVPIDQAIRGFEVG